MEMLLTALGTLAGAALIAATGALSQPGRRVAAILAPCGIMLGCALGLAAALDLPASRGAEALTLPWGLPFAPHGITALALDPLSRLFLLPVFGLGLVCSLSGMLSLRHYAPGEHNLGAHWFFFALLLLAQSVVCTTPHAVLFLMAWEVMSVAPFFLIEFHDNEAPVREASWIYLVAAHLGALFLLLFFALLWQQSGTTLFAFIIDPASATGTALFIFALLGFGAKAGLVPLHVWLPEAHPAAPSHVSAFLSGSMINAGLYGLFRMLDFFGPVALLPAWWGWALLALGLGTGLVGILKAMAQSNLKRLLAYSSVENMGIMLMGLGAGLVGMQTGQLWIALLGFAASLLHMLNHAAFKGLLFLCAGEVLHSVHTVRLDHLGGLQKRLPLVGMAFALGAASIACLPPLNGFAGEFLLALGLAGGLQLPFTEASAGLLAALAGLALISGLAAATYIKAYGMAFLGEPRTGAAESAVQAPAPELLPLLPPALACVALGLGAGWLLPLLLTALPLPESLLTAAQPLADRASSLLLRTALLGMGMALCVFFLLGLRRVLLHEGNAPTRRPTWGCGFQKGSARIQYTGGSFSEPTSRLLGTVMGLRVKRGMDKGYFPAKGTLDVQAVDRVRTSLFTPFFEAVEKLCDALKIIQHGRIHLYILYMLLTVVVLLIWGLQGGLQGGAL